MSHSLQRESQKSLLAAKSNTALRLVCKPRQLRSAFHILLFVLTIASVMANRTVVAAESASATITDQPLGGGVFRYNVALKDTGSTNVGTLWFSWVPGEDFMTTSPTNVLAPANWAGNVMHAGATDGYSIQFVNSFGPLTPGNTLSGFKFDSTMTPAPNGRRFGLLFHDAGHNLLCLQRRTIQRRRISVDRRRPNAGAVFVHPGSPRRNRRAVAPVSAGRKSALTI